MVPKFVWGLLGPSLGHVNRQHGLDRGEPVAGEVSDQLLGATPGGHDLETYPGPLLGAQGRHAGGKGHESELMVTFTDRRAEQASVALSTALVGAGQGHCFFSFFSLPPGSRGPSSPETHRQGRWGCSDLPNMLSPQDQLQALVTWTCQEFRFGEPQAKCKCVCLRADSPVLMLENLCGPCLGRPSSGSSHHPTRAPRPGTHSILRLPSSRPLPSTISTQFFTGSSSGLEKSICTFTGFRTWAWSSSCRERGRGVSHLPLTDGLGRQLGDGEDVTEDEGREDCLLSPPKCQ